MKTKEGEEGRLLADAAEKVSAHAVAMPTTQSHANTAQAGGEVTCSRPSRAELSRTGPVHSRVAHAVTSLLGEETETMVRTLAGWDGGLDHSQPAHSGTLS